MTAKCRSAITNFINAIRPTRYSTDDIEAGELLEAESVINQRWPEFEALSEDDWSNLRHQTSRTDVLYLWYYAVRMAEMAVRRNDENLVHFGLMALIVDDKHTDQRDVYTALALLLDATKRIHGDANSIFKGVAKLGTKKIRSTIETYLDERGGETSMDNVLEGLGYTASGAGESFCYRTTVL